MKPLDFLIIGAQKSATTALFKYLHSHPSIQMPAAKEAPFYTDVDCTNEKWQVFCRQYFSDETSLWGKATPQYMADSRIPKRIAAHAPDTKLIAIVRDPIERAWSHFQMGVRRNTETRSFDEAVEDLLKPENIQKARKGMPPLHESGYESEGDYYLAWGEYGRILHQYLQYFPSEQLLILNTVEIKHSPEYVIDKVLAFIGLPVGYRPDNLGEVVHSGGKAVVPLHWLRNIVNLPLLSSLWQQVPDKTKNSLRYWFEQFNIKKPKRGGMPLSEENKSRLQQYYSPDVKYMSDEIGINLPWLEQYR